MANNTMNIKCVRTGGVICVAKYYPEIGWQANKDLTDRLMQFLESTQPDCSDLLERRHLDTGETDYVLDFESKVSRSDPSSYS